MLVDYVDICRYSPWKIWWCRRSHSTGEFNFAHSHGAGQPTYGILKGGIFRVKIAILWMIQIAAIWPKIKGSCYLAFSKALENIGRFQKAIYSCKPSMVDAGHGWPSPAQVSPATAMTWWRWIFCYTNCPWKRQGPICSWVLLALWHRAVFSTCDLQLIYKYM